MQGKSVLEIGFGAGYDARSICAAGATYTGVDITQQNVERARDHLAGYGFTPTLLHGDAEALPFPSETFDFVFSNGVLHHTTNISAALREALRVLRPGGDAWLIVYNRDSIFHWLTIFLFDYVLKLGFRRGSFRNRLARIEYTTSDELPLVNVYSRREFERLLRDAGFEVRRTWIRKLTPEDLPAIPVFRRYWRRVPQRWLDRLAMRWGWYLVTNARRPIDDR
jgi:ubiquinone/menaquinone biosynthesis C-methylase UbiE